jgi:hypothetical protein
MTMMMTTTATMTMMSTRTPMKRKNLRNLQQSAVHPARPFRHHTIWGIALLVCLTGTVLAGFGKGALIVSAGAPAAQKKPSPDDCVFRVTVFNEKGARFPDVEFTAHPVGKKKPHWDGYSDARGDFSFRVSNLGDYEIAVKTKGYEVQTKKVTSEAGEKLDIVMTLVPRAPKKL